MSGVQELSNPADLARATLKELLARRLPATPDNYTRVYVEIASPRQRAATVASGAMLAELADEVARQRGDDAPDAQAFRSAVTGGDWTQAKLALKRLLAPAPQVERADGHWAPLVRELLTQWDGSTPGMTKARKREALEHVLGAFAGSDESLGVRLKGLLRTWAAQGTTPAATTAADETGLPDPRTPAPLDAVASREEPPPPDPLVLALREMFQRTVHLGLAERRVFCTEILGEASMLASALAEVVDQPTLAPAGERAKKLWILLEQRGDDGEEIQHGLLRILHLVLVNTAELVADDQWLQGQLTSLASLAAGPISRKTIETLEKTLRDIVLKQGLLKKSIEEAKGALKSMVTTFIDRVGTIVDHTGEYQDRLTGYQKNISSATSIPEISDVVVSLMNDTRGVQADLKRSHTELVEARAKVDAFGAEVRRLETELADVSQRLLEDALTELLNRRGLARAFDGEAARADRHGTPMCLALLDIDHFKKLNDTFGHQTGDEALVHLTRIVRESIRPSDIVARFGGEEFVILLPDAQIDEAVAIMQRVQRELTRRFFLHDNQRILITFSAGVVQRMPGELRDAMIGRADRCLYAAKQAGRNRVIAG